MCGNRQGVVHFLQLSASATSTLPKADDCAGWRCWGRREIKIRALAPAGGDFPPKAKGRQEEQASLRVPNDPPSSVGSDTQTKRPRRWNSFMAETDI